MRTRANGISSRTPPVFNGGERAAPSSAARPAHPMIGMQRAIGNAATQAAMAPSAPPVQHDYDSLPASAPAQRAATPEYSSMPEAPAQVSSSSGSPAAGYQYSNPEYEITDIPEELGREAASPSGPPVQHDYDSLPTSAPAQRAAIGYSSMPPAPASSSAAAPASASATPAAPSAPPAPFYTDLPPELAAPSRGAAEPYYSSMPPVPAAASASAAAPAPAAPRSADPNYTYSTPYGVYTSVPAEPDRGAASAAAPRSADPSYTYSTPYGVYTSVPAEPDRGTASAAAPAPEAPAAPTRRGRANATAASNPAHLPGFAMKSMGENMPAFDTQVQRAGVAHAPLKSTTHYMRTEEERQKYARGFDKDGRMINASSGTSLNTIGAKAAPAHGSKPDRHIFTMDGKGRFHTADAIHETTSRGEAAKAAGMDVQERFHHSSFHAGADVAGAGELQVRDGTVELVSDTSGHYQPGSKQMMQTVQQLEKNNVPVERLGVEFTSKKNEQGVILPAMQASAVELLGYANHSPETAEKQMRTMHAKKDNVLAELRARAQRQQQPAAAAPAQVPPASPDVVYEN